MTLAQALAYFSREALLGLWRSWKVSLLAIVTIAVSLFLGGVFLLVSDNLRQLVSQWRRESKIVVYLEPGATATAREALRGRLAALPWTSAVTDVPPEEARRRFVQSFPSLAGLLEGWGEEPLPGSLEVAVSWREADRAELDAWAAELEAAPEVAMVDDDRDWLAQVETMVVVLEGLGLVVGAILLGTAVFTIASVIRLTAYLYHDEIAVMRQVGATEFFIRGPFYVEGLFQGVAGGALAVATLFAAHSLVVGRSESVVTDALAGDFLAPGQLVALVVLGGAAGLAGAVASLRRESLGQTAEVGSWAD